MKGPAEIPTSHPEATYPLRRAGGAVGQRTLWKLLETRRVEIAEATLVALAEERGERRIFTLDEDFQVYRIHGRSRFEIIPG